MSAPAPDSAVEPTKKLELDPQRALPDALAHAMAGIVGYARDQAALASADPEKAVHEYRKSVRRARALLKLLAPFLAEAERAALTEELRGAMRETSAARDADVLVTLVASQERKPKTQAALDALEQLLRERQGAAHAEGGMVHALQESSLHLAGVPSRVRAALSGELSRGALRRSLAQTYRRARRACQRAAETLEDEHVHGWRKRVKELRYQLELLESVTGPLAEHQALSELAEALGQVTDLIVLRDCALAHSEALAAHEGQRLIDKLERRVPKRARALLAERAALFELKPGRFARQVFARLPQPAPEASPPG